MLLTQGLMSAILAGLLIYAATVEMIAGDFVFGDVVGHGHHRQAPMPNKVSAGKEKERVPLIMIMMRWKGTEMSMDIMDTGLPLWGRRLLW
ncbi:uncharacterized protein LACBIDRAFT_314028 [Laccaria bicolor S238N-H82]|uniref:Predicted protein n=1 Tax=Laccaria bicolor (strain S238N-H82 / ATCC MYA-4686) TaxID=486041 RepID=B0D1F2_LACBS|nr:uncharacterized protein LACBIDRAFT_314028 [Laccaria bicolor S238N-H82]EDR11988.1 predicted protein [Laccaria bicolor S238N-H82]|eukprot:XP_001877885.1 predicted protein [Laccaria bicolor S238N-H82]